MDDGTLAALAYDNLYPFYELLAQGEPSSFVERRGDVQACVVPAASERSFMNGVIYADPGSLEAALPDLARIYDQAGVSAWTIWVRTGDRRAAEVAAVAGHALDARPTAMAMPLAQWRATNPPPAGIGAIGVADVGHINDEAYNWKGDFSRAFNSAPPELRMYGARSDGAAVACAGWLRHGADCAVYMVATLPEAQGHGLATALMTSMLADAAAEGCRTTSLQASAAGFPIYLKLGYRDLGSLEMWERRS